MKKNIMLVIILACAVLCTGCAKSGVVVSIAYDSIEEAILDIGFTTEFEIIDQVEFDEVLVLSVVDQDDSNWTTSLYEHDGKYYGFDIDAFEDVYFYNYNNGTYLRASAFYVKLPKGILISIGFLDKTHKDVYDNYKNEYVNLKTVEMNTHVMELDEIPEDYKIYVDGEEYTLSKN